MTSAPAHPRPALRLSVVRPRAVKMSWREIDVLRELLMDGADNCTIGRRLHLSEDTIKTHFRRVFAKVEVPSRAALAVALLRREIVVFDPNSRVVEF